MYLGECSAGTKTCSSFGKQPFWKEQLNVDIVCYSGLSNSIFNALMIKTTASIAAIDRVDDPYSIFFNLSLVWDSYRNQPLSF